MEVEVNKASSVIRCKLSLEQELMSGLVSINKQRISCELVKDDSVLSGRLAALTVIPVIPGQSGPVEVHPDDPKALLDLW